MGSRAAAGGDSAGRRTAAGCQRSCGHERRRAAVRGRWSPCSGSAKAARWLLPAKHRGDGACSCRPRIARSTRSGSRRCDGSRCPAGDPMQLTVTPGAAPGADIPLRIVVRNASFLPIPDAAVDVRVTAPDGRVESVRAVPDPARPGNDGHFVATIRPESAGVFKLAARAQQGGTTVGTANTSVLVGGVDLEMTDPHLNRGFFDRLAAASGGRVLGEDDLTGLANLLVAGRARCRAGRSARSLAHGLVVCGDTDATRRRVGAAAHVGAQMSRSSETKLTTRA